MSSHTSLVDATMPTYDVREVHAVLVDAPIETVWSALHEVPLRAVPVFRGLMTLRELPIVLVGRRWITSDVDRPILDQMIASGFVLVGERPAAEIVLGLAARPWRLVGAGGGPTERESFVRFRAPGWVKAVLAFHVEPADGGDQRTRLVSETRVLATDTSARRRFRVYWMAIGWASALTRSAWLEAVKRRAERTPIYPS